MIFIKRLATVCLALLLLTVIAAAGDGPLPAFTFRKVALHPKDLSYAPTGELIHPTIIKTAGRVEKPLGRYYLYYAPHKHVAISMAYADSIEGPWVEYEKNPVITGPSAPDIRWIAEKKKFFMWGHVKNCQTELWTSADGIHFEHHGVSVTAKNIGTRNATYSRVYEYPLAQYGSRYIMLYSGFIEDREIRCTWLAHSKDAEQWVQLKTPLLEPVEGDNKDIYGPALLRWKNRNFVVYQDHTAWRGGNVKYVELDRKLNPVGAGGKRYVLIDPPAGPPLNDRYRGGEFYRENGTLYLYSSASKNPRLIVFATANIEGSGTKKITKEKGKDRKAKKEKGKNKKPKKQDRPAGSVSLDDVLKNVELETVYETAFDKPIRMIKEDQLFEDKKRVRRPPEDVDWVLEGPAEVFTRSGRLHIKNDGKNNCVLWNTREFPESFVAAWDFRHHFPRGLAIIFFAARGGNGGSIFTPGLPRRGGNFGNYTRGKIHCYHTSYTAISEDGVPRGATHLKKNVGDKKKGGKVARGPGPIDGTSGTPHRIRLAKLKNRIILEIDGKVSFDWTDRGEKGGAPLAGGQIGFRQMRHTGEASYGGVKIQRVKP